MINFFDQICIIEVYIICLITSESLYMELSPCSNWQKDISTDHYYKNKVDYIIMRAAHIAFVKKKQQLRNEGI